MEFKMKGEAFQVSMNYGELTISGNDEHGFRPFQLLVSSVAACSGGVLRKILAKKRISFEDISIQAEVERMEAEANRVAAIRLHFQVKGELTQEQLIKSMEVARKNCPIVQSVQGSIEITETGEVLR